ncbi:MAG: isoprenyl transferase [Alphaproteobacteria bacterium]
MTPDARNLHVAIIMDGNGRWAAARGLPRTMGHRAGIEAIKRTLRACRSLPISYLTIYSFSSENWRRPAGEVRELMDLMRFFMRSELANLHKEGVRIKVIGDRSALSPDIVAMIEHAETLTAANTGFTLVSALSYGSRQEITAAARRLAAQAAAGTLKADEIDEAALTAVLDTHDVPDPDLIIRTSGEQRLSNFLLWQAAYAEFVFLDTLWPDFGENELRRALDEFDKRERRYGATIGE